MADQDEGEVQVTGASGYDVRARDCRACSACTRTAVPFPELQDIRFSTLPSPPAALVMVSSEGLGLSAASLPHTLHTDNAQRVAVAKKLEC